MRTLVWSAAVVVFFLAACKREHATRTASASTAPSARPVPSERRPEPSAAAPAPALSATPDEVGPRLLPVAKVCRALEVKGRVVDEEKRLVTTSAPLDRATWLDLDPKATLAVKNTENGRELVFAGPGRILPCIGGEERFYLVRGAVRTAAVAGARPGAEVLVATPHGVVRYGDARLDVKVEPSAVAIRSDVGDAWFESRNADGTGIAEEKIAAGKRLERKGLSVDVKALVGTCEAMAAVAEERARVVLKPGPSDQGAPLGARAAEHMRARRTARFACALAGAALGTLENVGDRVALDQVLGRAEARYRGTPSNPSGTEKSEFR